MKNGRDSGGEKPSGHCGCVDKAAEFVFGGLERIYQKVGLASGVRPWALMLTAVVIAGACMSGFTRLKNESRGEKLWVPGGTEAQDDKDIVEGTYPKFARFEEVIIASEPFGRNVLTPDALNYINELHKKIVDIEAENPLAKKDGNKKLIAYERQDNQTERLCFQRGSVCLQNNIIEVFSSDPENWETEELILEIINSGDLKRATGDQVELLSLLGGVERNEETGDIVSAKTIATNYFLANNEVVSASKGSVDKKAEKWEDVFLDILEDESNKAKEAGYRIYRFATRSFADEFGGSINGDLGKLNVAIILLLIYAVSMMSKWSEGCVGSRVVLTIGGFISIGLAVGAALGLGGLFGLFYSPLMGVFPFLLIGIGVDDMFVIVNAYDRTPSHLTVPERLSLALGRSGSSITVTSLTDFGAFLIGSNTSLPALRAFSIFAALGILLTLVFQVLFFTGWLVYDEKHRRLKNRMDVFCCFKSCTPAKSCCCSDNILENILGRMGLILSNVWMKVAVFVVFGLVAAGGIYGVTKIEVDADVDDFIPPDSYLGDWNDVREEYYKTIGADVGIYMQNVDFASEDIQVQLTDMYEAFRDNPYIVDSTVRSWYEEFKAFEGGEIIPPRRFYRRLTAWLNVSPSEGGGANFQSDIVMKEDGTGIEASRFTGNHFLSQKSKILVRHMNSLRETVSNFPAPLGPECFAYGGEYVQYEQYKAIGREALTNIGLALLMVLVVIVLLLVNPLAAGLTFLSIAFVVIELVGYMHWWGANIDNVVVIFLVISLGLSVDYSVHIAHAFLVSSGTPNERMVKALRELGPAVIHGAFSTFVAVLVLSLSISYVFVVFFRSLFLCVLLGLSHGMILLPVAMSVFVPKKAPNGSELEQPPSTELTAEGVVKTDQT